MHNDAKTHLFCLLNEAINPASPCTANRDPQSTTPSKKHAQKELNIQKHLNKMDHNLDAQNISNQSTLFLQSPSFGKTLVHSDKHLLEALLGLKH